jgi:hypothetical protein
VDERNKNENRYADDREIGTTRHCRHGQHVVLTDNFPSAKDFVAVPMLPSNCDHGIRLKHETLAMITQAKRLTTNAIVTMNTGLWPNSCKNGNLLKILFDELLSVHEAPSLRRGGKTCQANELPLGLGPQTPTTHGIKQKTMNSLSGQQCQATVLWRMRHQRTRHKTKTVIRAPTTKPVITLVMMVIVLSLTTLTIEIRTRGANWCWTSAKALDGACGNGVDRRGLIKVAASAKVKAKQHAKACMVGDFKSLVRSKGVCKAHGGGKRCHYPGGCGKSAIGQTMFCKAHGGGKRCQYPGGCGKSAIGPTMFCVAHCGGKRCQYPDGCGKSAQGSTHSAKPTAGASDANVRTVVARLRLAGRCFA